jgi:carbamoyl-phosphate synthase large subunit
VKDRILVTGTGGHGIGMSILHALKHPGAQERWDVIAADANPFSWGLYTAEGGALIPYPDDPGYLHQVPDLIRRCKISAVIPGTERETVFLAEHRDEFPVPVIANRADLMPLMQDKRKVELTLLDLDLPRIPGFDWDERHYAIDDFGFPLVVKPYLCGSTGGSKGLFLVTTREELEGLAGFVSPQSTVQPYTGDHEHEYSVTVLSSKEGKIFGSFVIHRELTGFSLHTAREFNGKRIAVSTGFTQGYIVRHPLLQDFCENLAVSLSSQGPLDIQLRLVGDTPYVFEIQPRFSFSTAFRATAGFNEPDILLRHWLRDEDFNKIDYRSDVAVMRALDHVLVPMKEMLGNG